MGAAGSSAAPLTWADMEALLQGLEDRIITKLSAQLKLDRALFEQHNYTIQDLETSMIDMQSRLLELEPTCSMLMQENKKLKLKTDDLENRSRPNNIRITGQPEKAEGPHPVFIKECLSENFGPDVFPVPIYKSV